MFRWLKLSVAGALALALLILGTHRATPMLASPAQVKRYVKLPIANQYDPVVILGAALGSVTVQAGRFGKPDTTDPITPFEAGDDWIQRLTLRLFNRTEAVIVAVNIDIVFPETGDGSASHPLRGVPLNLGRIPENAAFDKFGNVFPQPAEWSPLSFVRGPMKVDLSDYIRRIRSGAESAIRLASSTKLEIELTSCYFSNGMKWANGSYFTPDSGYPGRWLPMERGYFPGFSDRNWPGSPGWAD
jgi:hypothetical protein